MKDKFYAVRNMFGLDYEEADENYDVLAFDSREERDEWLSENDYSVFRSRYVAKPVDDVSAYVNARMCEPWMY